MLRFVLLALVMVGIPPLEVQAQSQADAPPYAALAGADDEVYQLTLLSLPERRAVVDTLLRQHRPHS